MPVETLDETGSTNADMVLRAAQGYPEGSWLRAMRQSGGRGRLGRVWESPAGNLYASTLVRITPADPPPASLALLAGVALHDCLSPWTGGHEMLLKWPNDLLLDGGKLSGILLERSGDAVIVGMGVNVAHKPEIAGRKTAALAELGGPDTPDAGAVMDSLVQSFAHWLEIWRRDGMAMLIAAWQDRAHSLGSALCVTQSNGETLTGNFAGLDPDGALRLCLAVGRTIAVHAGDVDLIRET